MLLPHPDDTIVAIATAWEPAPVGIVRLSGPASFTCAAAVAPDQPPTARNGCARGWVQPDADVRLPADLFWFHAPRSYTGQDAVEIHTPGAPALLRALADRLVAAGARPAQPGEFTARAYLNGKLSAEQAEWVPALIHAADAESARRALRQPARAAEHAAWSSELADLIAALEAGIDFAEEEDVRFISADDVVRRIAALRAEVERAAGTRRRVERELNLPHVMLCGLPNAGKSALFNALLGQERAIVSPVPGSTRDVLSAVVDLDGVRAVLQDSAGREDPRDAIEAAARAAADGAVGGADLIVWLHAADRDWSAAERAALEALPGERSVVVYSKSDLVAGARIVGARDAVLSSPGGMGLRPVLGCAAQTQESQDRPAGGRSPSAAPLQVGIAAHGPEAHAPQRYAPQHYAPQGPAPQDDATRERPAGGRSPSAAQFQDAMTEHGPEAHAPQVGENARSIHVCSVITGDGLGALRSHLRARLESLRGGSDEQATLGDELALDALSAAEHAAREDSALRAPEILVLLLRRVWEQLQESLHQPLSDAVLARIFSSFCIGK